MARSSVSALGHPVILLAAVVMLLNDLGLRVWMPGPLTGKLSDAGFLVVAPVVAAAGLECVGVRAAVARGIGLVAVAGVYVALQLWPPLGVWFSAAHVADVEDLFVLPALLGAVWVWRQPAPPWATALVGGPLGVGALVATTLVEVEPGSWPCAEDGVWSAGEPLRLRLFDSPALTSDFLAGTRLLDRNGVELPLVAAVDPSGMVLLCARDGLAANASFTWEIGPWTGNRVSNELPFSHPALPTVVFSTGELPGLAAATADACFAAATDAAVTESACGAGLADGCQDSGECGCEEGNPC